MYAITLKKKKNYGGLMNTNNCMRNVSLIALCMATASTQCMLNGLKTVITCVGTAIGVGLPTVPFLMVAKKAYTLTKNPDASIEEQNASTQAIESIKKHFLGVSMYTEDEQKKFDQPLYKPSSQEEKFLRQYIPHPTRIVMNPLPKTSCSIPLSGVVFIENKTFASEKTLEQALEQNDHETLKTFAAIAQHENEHIKNKDGLNIIIPKTTLPLITTTVATKNVKKISRN